MPTSAAAPPASSGSAETPLPAARSSARTPPGSVAANSSSATLAGDAYSTRRRISSYRPGIE